METYNTRLISDEYIEVYRTLPIKLQFAYGVGHVLNDVCASLWFTYLLVYFHLVLQFSNREAGFLLLIGQVADALSTPFVGFESDKIDDNFWLCRYGRRKVWHLVGSLCVVITFPFIFSPCIDCTESHKFAQMFYYCIFIIIFQFGWASVQISHLSLIPELTPNENDRTRLTTIRYCFTVISNVLVYVITWATLRLTDQEDSKIGPNDISKFQHIVWTVLLLGIICTIIFHVFVKEVNNFSNNVRGTSLRTPILHLLRSYKIYQVAMVYMATRLFINLGQVFIPLYLHETLDMTASALAVIPLIMFTGSFLASIIVEKMNRFLGRRVSYFIGTVIGIASCMWIKLGNDEQLKANQIYIIALLFGMCGSIILITSLGLTADLIGNKTNNSAFVYGIMSFCDKLANGIFVIVIQDLHKNPSNVTYYRSVITYLCGGAVLLGGVAMIRKLKLDSDNATNIT